MSNEWISKQNGVEALYGDCNTLEEIGRFPWITRDLADSAAQIPEEGNCIIIMVVKNPRVKNSKKLKSKAWVTRLLNRSEERKSRGIARNWNVVWWLQCAGKNRTLPVNPLRPGWFCGPNHGKRKPKDSSLSLLLLFFYLIFFKCTIIIIIIIIIITVPAGSAAGRSASIVFTHDQFFGLSPRRGDKLHRSRSNLAVRSGP